MSDFRPQVIDVLVVPRDRFSMFGKCLDALYVNTDMPFRVFVIVGGADKVTEDSLRHMQARKSNLSVVFVDHFLMQGEARNIALRHADQRFCVILENDTIVHKNWLSPMLECQREEGAAAVMPLVLWYKRIHAAGCTFEEQEKNGERIFKHKILYTDIRRKRTDYPECHCLLLDRQLLPGTDIFEDVEPFDVDLGLTIRKNGLSAFVEPRSVVTYLALPSWEVRDIPLFKFRWDPVSWKSRNRLFSQKWAVTYDHSSKVSSYRRQQWRLGFARWYPNKFTVGLSNKAIGLEKKLLPFFMPGQPYAS